MSGETDWPAIIIAFGGLITSTTAAVVSIYGLRRSAGNSVKITEASDKITEATAKITETSVKVDETSAKVDEVHKLADGLSSSAQAHAHDAGHAEGEAKGRADVVAEQGANALARERGKPPKGR